MARRYRHVETLAAKIDAARESRGLTYDQLGAVAGIDVGQTWRICKAKFATLNPGVLKICNALGVRPEIDGLVVPDVGADGAEAKLAAEVVAAWDRTEAGARLLTRVLRALRSS